MDSLAISAASHRLYPSGYRFDEGKYHTQVAGHKYYHWTIIAN
jgi:hypothetical protein